jgi:hypothetical protein
MTCANKGCLVEAKAFVTNFASRNALDVLLLAIDIEDIEIDKPVRGRSAYRFCFQL